MKNIGGVMVNYISDDEICPEEHREDRRFGPCRKGSLFTSDEACLSRGSVATEGPLLISGEGICPAAPNLSGSISGFPPPRAVCTSALRSTPLPPLLHLS